MRRKRTWIIVGIVVVLVVGGIVLVVLLALYMPIFSMSESVGAGER